MSIFFVRSAVGVSSDSVTVCFPENNAGDTLIAVFASTATSADFGDPSTDDPTITDSNGTVWTLAYSNVNFADALATVFCAIAVYICARCPNSSLVTLPMPGSLFPGDVLATWSGGVELQSTFSIFTFDASAFNTDASTTLVLPLAQDGTDSLTIAGMFDASLTASNSSTLNSNTGQMDTLGNLFSSSTGTSVFGWGNTTFSTSNILMLLDFATDVFGFAFVMTGSNASGGGAATTLTFSMNKGPDPIVLPEGRAIATVQVDCTQQPLVTSVNFPELCVLDLTNLILIQGFVVAQFDLEHLFQGAGLTEVRTIICWARPAFRLTDNGREDLTSSNVLVYPAILTNTTTLQTISFGENAATIINESAQFGMGQYTIMPFPANKNSLKYRFICPQHDGSAPVGKYIFQFLNFEVAGAFASEAALLSIVTD